LERRYVRTRDHCEFRNLERGNATSGTENFSSMVGLISYILCTSLYLASLPPKPCFMGPKGLATNVCSSFAVFTCVFSVALLPQSRTVHVCLCHSAYFIVALVPIALIPCCDKTLEICINSGWLLYLIITLYIN